MGRMDHLEPEALAAYQDDGLTPVERETAHAHLSQCALCRDRLGTQVRAAGGREGATASASGSIGGPHDRSVFREHLAAAAIGALLLGVGLWWALDRAPGQRAADPRAREAAPVTPAPAPPAAIGELAGGDAGSSGDGARPSDAARRTNAARPGDSDRAVRAPEGEAEPELLALRSGAREMEGKTFRLQGDEWVDDAWTVPPRRAPIPLVRGTSAWRAALVDRPALARYGEVGPRVLVVLDSLAFRILPAP